MPRHYTKRIKQPKEAPAVERIIQNPYPLDLNERNRLRELMADPVFKKAWGNAQNMKPGLLIQGGTDGALGEHIASNRLHQLQGWEFFRVALLGQLEDPIPPRVDLATEQYPDSAVP